MNNDISKMDGTVTYYAVKIGGNIISRPLMSKTIAEKYRQGLSDSQRMIAEIVPVTSSGLEILLG